MLFIKTISEAQYLWFMPGTAQIQSTDHYLKLTKTGRGYFMTKAAHPQINNRLERKTNTMKLTKLQRYTAYCIMQYELPSSSFLCVTLIPLGFEDPDELIICEFMPELWAKKPKKPHSECCWFNISEYKKRLQILKQCIKETHPDNPQNK